MSERVLIIGAGNWMFGDEATGMVAANEVGRRLGQIGRVCNDVAMIEHITGSPWDCGAELILFIGAVQPHEPQDGPTWHSVDLDEPGLLGPHAGALQALAEALAPTRKVLLTYAIVGEAFGLGDPPSNAAHQVAGDLVSRIEIDVRRCLALEPGPVGNGLISSNV